VGEWDVDVGMDVDVSANLKGFWCGYGYGC